MSRGIVLELTRLGGHLGLPRAPLSRDATEAETDLPNAHSIHEMDYDLGDSGAGNYAHGFTLILPFASNR